MRLGSEASARAVAQHPRSPSSSSAAHASSSGTTQPVPSRSCSTHKSRDRHKRSIKSTRIDPNVSYPVPPLAPTVTYASPVPRIPFRDAWQPTPCPCGLAPHCTRDSLRRASLSRNLSKRTTRPKRIDPIASYPPPPPTHTVVKRARCRSIPHPEGCPRGLMAASLRRLLCWARGAAREAQPTPMRRVSRAV